GSAWWEAQAIATRRSSSSGHARTSGSAWIGFAEERKKVTRLRSPASAITSPSRTATAWTRWTDSTVPPRRTATRIGSTGEEPTRCQGEGGRPDPGPGLPLSGTNWQLAQAAGRAAPGVSAGNGSADPPG